MQRLSEQIRAAQEGDSQAMESLMAEYSHAIHEECSRIGLNNYVDLSHTDLTQEVFLQVWKKIPQFRGIAENDEHLERSFEKWLRKNARTTLSDLLRSRQAQKRKPKEAIQTFDDMGQSYRIDQSSPSSMLRRVEEGERVRAAISHCLDEQSQQIVLRHVVDGESFQQIAESLSLSYERVRYLFHRSQSTLAQWLDAR